MCVCVNICMYVSMFLNSVRPYSGTLIKLSEIALWVQAIVLFLGNPPSLPSGHLGGCFIVDLYVTYVYPNPSSKPLDQIRPNFQGVLGGCRNDYLTNLGCTPGTFWEAFSVTHFFGPLHQHFLGTTWAFLDHLG